MRARCRGSACSRRPRAPAVSSYYLDRAGRQRLPGAGHGPAFAHELMEEGANAAQAIATACRVRLGPILMTSLATIIGLLPMALKMGERSSGVHATLITPGRPGKVRSRSGILSSRAVPRQFT